MKRPILKLIMAVCFGFLSFSVFSQTTVEAPKTIPPSPQSQLFEQYINHEISEYNGLPDIAIPLYEITINGLKIPIALTYHASGIQFMQHDGEVGLGWSISASGYRISRSINGKCDFVGSFYDDAKLQNYLDNTHIDVNKFQADQYLEAINNPYRHPTYGLIDGRHDLFTYMTPSTTGHFVITDRNHAAKTYATAMLDQRLDKVSINRLGGQLTDQNGFRYYFGDAEEVSPPRNIELTDNASGPLTAQTAWVLREVQSPYGEAVQFQYNMYGYNTMRNHRHKNTDFVYVNNVSMTVSPATARIIQFPEAMTSQTDSWDIQINSDPYNSRTISPYLSQIMGVKEKVVFSRVTRNDKLNSPTLITEINIYEKKSNRLIKKIAFTYRNMSSKPIADTTTNEYPWHTVLTSVEVGNGTAVEQKYTFDYYEPPKSKYGSPDYWNHYVFSRSRGLQQELFIPTALGDKQFVYSISGISGAFKNKRTVNEHYQSNASKYFIDRSADIHNFNAFSLKRITYPTGGFTEYEYELNQYKNEQNATISGAGQRVKKIKSYASATAAPVITMFKYGEKETGLGISPNKIHDNMFSEQATSYLIYFIPYFTLQESGVCHIKEVSTFSSSPINAFSHLFTVYYPEVATYQTDDNNSVTNGKTISTYHLAFAESMNSQNPAAKPRLSTRSIYSTQGIQQKDVYTYQLIEGNTYTGLKSKRVAMLSGDKPNTGIPPHPNNDWEYTYNWVFNIFEATHTKIGANIWLPSSHTSTTYSDGEALVKTVSYTYNSNNQLSTTSETSSQGSELQTTLMYMTDDTNTNANKTNARNRNLYGLIAQEVVVNGGQEIKRVRYNYSSLAGTAVPLPVSVDYSTTGESNLEKEFDYLYDQSNGKLIQYIDRSGVPVSYLWGYNNAYPVLQVVGDSYNNAISHLNSIELQSIREGSYTSSELHGILDKIRTYYKIQQQAVHVSSYSYIPLLGLHEEIAPDSISTHYRYDKFGRLRRILDHNGNVINQYSYHYANQADDGDEDWDESEIVIPPVEQATYSYEQVYSGSTSEKWWRIYRTYDDGRRVAYYFTLSYGVESEAMPGYMDFVEESIGPFYIPNGQKETILKLRLPSDRDDPSIYFKKIVFE